MAEKEPISPPRHIEEVPYICLPEFAIEQKERIAQLEHHIDLMEQSKGSLNSSSMGQITKVLGLGITVMGMFSAMWFAYSNSQDRLDIAALQKDNETMRANLARDEAETASLQAEVSGLKEAQSNALTPADLQARFDGIDSAMLTITEQYERADTALEGRFTRTVGRRLEPRIEQDERRLEDAINRLNKHLQEK